MTSSQGDNYLTWVQFSSLRFAEVSTAKDRVSSPDANPIENSGAEIHRIAVGDLLARQLIVDGSISDFSYSIYVSSIEKDAKGTYTVRFAGANKKIIYTVVSDSTAKLGWRLVSQTPAQGAAELQRKEAQRK